MKGPVVVLVAVLAFAGGWWLARAGDADTADRLDALEARVEALAAGRPAPRPAPAEAVSLKLDGAPFRGPETAPITIVEFSDFECPYCLRAKPTLARLRAEYPESVRVVFKHFPLSFHKKAISAHRAALAAGEQGRFWEMHDLIFANPRALDPESMTRHARALGLDLAAFEKAFGSERLRTAIDRDLAEGRAAGVRGTPAFFINGRLLSGAQPFERFKQLVDEELARRAS